MAELAKGGVDLRRGDGSVYFWIVRGWIDDIPAVRGVDWVAPGAEGRFAGNRVADSRRVLLNGQLKAASEAGFLTLLQEMESVWDPTAAVANLVVADGYRGLAVGETATLGVKTVNLVPAGEFTGFRRNYSWELECVTDPPAWVFAP